MKSSIFESFCSVWFEMYFLMQWKSGCGHLVSHELQRGGGSTSIVGRAGKKAIVHSEHVSRCAVMCRNLQRTYVPYVLLCSATGMCIQMYFGIGASGEHLTYCDVSSHVTSLTADGLGS